MFGISGEHIVILAIVLLILGPRRLPELGNTLGKAIKNFKDAIGGIEEAKFRHVEDTKTASADPKSETGVKTDSSASDQSSDSSKDKPTDKA